MKKIIILAVSFSLATAFAFAQNRPAGNQRNSGRNQTTVNRQDNNRNNRSSATVKRPNSSQTYRHNNYRPGYTVHKVPKQSVKVYHNNVNYYYNNGVYYKPYNNSYVVARAPIGVRISVLPVGYRLVTVNRNNYYYHSGAYYQKVNNYYEVVRPPIGALVEYVPANAERVDVNGETYFIADGVQYKAVLVNNEIWYQVIKI